MWAVITGASRGIGRAIAETLAGAGYNLLITGRDKERVEVSARDLKTAFPDISVHAMPADLSIKSQVTSFGEWCLRFGVPTVLVNNAGSYQPGQIVDEAEGQMEKMMDVNFYSAYHLTRMLIGSMMEKSQGHIFNMCSIASLDAYPGGGSYSISKFALLGFSKNLRRELMPHGIKVTALVLGAVATDSWGDFDNSKNRIMNTKDIASIVYACLALSPSAVPEEILMRPQLGDL